MNPVECSICFENIHQEKMYITPCFHLYCNDCFQIWKEKCEGDITCPNCRTVIEKKAKVIEIPYIIQEEEEIEEEVRDDDNDEDDEDEYNTNLIYYDIYDNNSVSENPLPEIFLIKPETGLYRGYSSREEYLRERQEYLNFMHWIDSH